MNVKVEEVADRISHMETFLSPNVHYIIVESRQNEDSAVRTASCLTEQYTFDWHKIMTSLNLSDNVHILSQPVNWFPEVAKRMWPIFHEAHSILANVDSETMEYFWGFCRWTGKEKDLKELYEDFQSYNDTSTVEAILFVTSVLERSLGNVYLLRGKTVPFLLRDLLATSELKSILGTIPTIFLQLLVGTPLSFNVRNLVWHGFLHPAEIPPSLATALFVAVASIGQLLSAELASIPRRPQASDLSELAEHMEPPPGDLVPHAVLSVLTESPLIPSRHINFWTSALQHYHRGSWGRCCLVALPQLEHLARVAYCVAHNCPSRLLTAESTTRYLTLDDLLDTSDTSMLSLLGEGLLQLLRDLLSLPTGPRLRDRLSHGEVDLADIPSCLAGHLLGAATAIAFRFRASSTQPYSNYTSRFHNIAILKAAILQTAKSITVWKQCPRPPETPWPSWNDMVKVNQDVCSLYQHLTKYVTATLTHEKHVDDADNWGRLEDLPNILEVFLSSVHIPIMPIPKSNTEAITLLRQTIDNIEAINANVTSSLEMKLQLLVTHKLRSRQRVTYGRFLNVVPRLEAVLKCVIIIVSMHLLEMSMVHTITERDQATYIRFLRTVLQFVALTASSSTQEKNRWEEIDTLSQQFCQQMLQNKHLVPMKHTVGTCQ
ncbi:endoplasmic reticulum membrane-associated RNA degradation protein-like isoform X1 [Schistocerca piceifrons]|uniref:endoplasmic reticulum membrane-associated RNA degradation protein-like isoform X1 n=2 Tax=Schistocerca piceifrons TaxID=274613 RepID=UPI001F5F7401|nr:endoplasmic reticulum membrane-associated RNA degradation protein-like isoform X1 [Schistocerca piceifrons]